MKINECFVGHQGEVNVGRYGCFVRLSGCNLQCEFCFGYIKTRRIPRLHTISKRIKLQEAKIGDKILTFNGEQKIVETKIKKVLTREVDKYYRIKINNKFYFVTPEHPFFTTKGLKETKDLTLEDEILHSTSEEKQSFKMKLFNPSFNKEIKLKGVLNTDWKKMGKILSKTIKEKQEKGIYYSPWSALSEEDKIKLRQLHSERQKKEKNSNWKGGKYYNFNQLKQLCKDNVLTICKKCNNNSFLYVHHIDNNKSNDSLENLTTICPSCHNQIHKRGYSFWKNNNRIDNKKLGNNKLSLMNDFLALQHNGFKITEIKLFDRNDKKYKYEYQKPKKLKVYNFNCEPYNSYLIDYMWVHNCDTKYARDEYIELTVEQLYEQLNTFIYIVFTGGEPLLQQEELNKLILKLQNNNSNIKIEIETNGTIKPKRWKNVVFNVSPKLSNSKNEYEKRIDKKVLQHHVLIKSNFKFVVETAEDVDEVNMIADKFQIPKEQIFLMPKGATRQEQLDNMEGVIKMAKLYGYNFSPRIHVLIFDKMRGV